jgi:hypothetical protein
MNTPIRRKEIDFDNLGYETAMNTGDLVTAQNICGLHIQAFRDELQPEISGIDRETENDKAKHHALHSFLYGRRIPVRDAAMLARRCAVVVLVTLVAIVGAASVASHTLTFQLFGFPLTLNVLLGLTITGIAGAVGYQLFEKILTHHKALEACFIGAAFVLCAWGLLELSQARGLMVTKATDASASTASSYVDDAPEGPSPDPEPHEADEGKVRAMLGKAIVKIMLAADLMLGILFGHLMLLWQGEDYVAWHKLRKISRKLANLERRRNGLLAMIEVATKQCMAGILRALHTPPRQHPPYHRLPVIVLFLLLAASPSFSQAISRHEGILLDVSGSIGKGGASSELFRDYLMSIKRLLATEPPRSRVWVSVISTDSFGSTGELLRGWTPDAQGVFTDNLDRARRQLASNFETRAAGLRPVASGTDIFGGLWHLKALLESGSAAGHIAKEIWVCSDMVNETTQFNMPALIPSGPEAMLRRAKSNNLVVPLSGYRIHVIGASPAGLNPYTWNTLKTFWTLYFREAGAELISYSAEARSER